MARTGGCPLNHLLVTFEGRHSVQVTSQPTTAAAVNLGMEGSMTPDPQAPSSCRCNQMQRINLGREWSGMRPLKSEIRNQKYGVVFRTVKSNAASCVCVCVCVDIAVHYVSGIPMAFEREQEKKKKQCFVIDT